MGTQIEMLQRFQAKYKIDPVSKCWNWTASKQSDGYGRFRDGGKMRKAHRVSFELHCGPIPQGEGHHGTCVLHKCDNRVCVNPEHLFLGTHDDNMADKVAKGRQVRHRGTGHGRAKLSETDVLAIREAEGMTKRKIAAQFGVSETVIGHVLSRKLWAHI
jgi:hypothetical protein